MLQELVETSETALLQSIVLIQHFPKLISDNHTEKALKILPSLAKDLQLVGTWGKQLDVYCKWFKCNSTRKDRGYWQI